MLLRLLRSPRFALAVLASLAAWTAAGAWVPWADPAAAPPWARAVGLDAPFTAWPFLAACSALFASTLACTWGRRARIARLARGDVEGAPAWPRREGADVAEFLRARGFRGDGAVLVRHRAALWGGWVLHAGLLVLMAGVVVQQAFQDSGVFQLVPGQAAALGDEGTVIHRSRGPLAPERPPALEVELVSFDPRQRQPGYAPDRRSRLRLRAGAEVRDVLLDRAAGATVGGTDVFQAIPSGLALVLDLEGVGVRVVHLEASGRRAATAAVTAPDGTQGRFVVEAARALDDAAGTGPLAMRWESALGTQPLEPGAVVRFGSTPARLVAVDRWARFTYSRNPGMPAVLAGFALVLAGSVLLVFPAGVARVEAPGTEVAARVWLARGAEALRGEWDAAARDGGGQA